MIKTENHFRIAAIKAGMDKKTARRYRKGSRKNLYENVWENIKSMLEINPELETKILFEDLQHRNPGEFADGQLRTLQRRIKFWRAVEAPQNKFILLKFIGIEDMIALFSCGLISLFLSY